MAKQTVISKKRKGPAPTGIGTPVVVRMQPKALSAVDDWRKGQEDLPSRPEAIRRLVEKALGGSSAPPPKVTDRPAKPVSKADQIAAQRRDR